MDQRTRNALRRPIEMLFSAALVLIVLTACGGDGDDDTPTEAPEAVQGGETAANTSVPVETRTVQVADGMTASPIAEVVAVPDGTPVGAVGDGTPTPAVVVADPTQPQATPSAATPSVDLGGILADVIDVTGTGDGALDVDTAVASPEAASVPEEGLAVVTSCVVESFPPYGGDTPIQFTTETVNFRAGPGVDCDPIGEPLAPGTTVEVLSDPVIRENDAEFQWVAVSVDGTQGWIATEFLGTNE